MFSWRTYWKKIEKFYNAEPFKQISREIIKVNDKQLNKKLAKKLINPYYFTGRALQFGINITLQKHHNSHAYFKKIIKQNHPGFGIEVRYLNKLLKEMATIYARLIDQFIIKYQKVFSGSFVKQDEDSEVFHETESFNKLNNNHILLETDIDNIDFKFTLEQQNQNEEMKSSGWNFDKTNSMTIFFWKTGQMKGSSSVKFPLRISAIFNIENKDKYCFFCRFWLTYLFVLVVILTLYQIIDDIF